MPVSNGAGSPLLMASGDALS